MKFGAKPPDFDSIYGTDPLRNTNRQGTQALNASVSHLRSRGHNFTNTSGFYENKINNTCKKNYQTH